MSYWQDRLKWQEEIVLESGISSSENELVRLYKRAAQLNERDMKALLFDMKKNELDSINDLYRYNRYWQVQAEINKRLIALGQSEIKILDKDLVAMYMTVQEYFNKHPKVFAQTKRGIAKELTLGYVDLNSPLMSQKAETIAKMIWCADGKNYSDRVWINMEKLQKSLVDGLSDTLIRGTNPDELVTQLTREQFGLTVEDKNEEAFSKAFQRSRTLVSTELAHIYNQAAIERYMEAGCAYYQVLVAPDNTSKAIAWNAAHKGAQPKEYPCEECQALNGKTFSFTEMEEGVNCPPIHPNCRCTIIPVIGGM